MTEATHTASIVRIVSKPDDPSFQNLLPTTTMVRIEGTLSQWIIPLLKQRAPNLKTVQLYPSQVENLSLSLTRLLHQYGLKTEATYLRPHNRTLDRGLGGAEFAARKQFLETIADEAKARLDDLIFGGHRGADMLLRFYGVRQARQTADELVEQFGYRDRSYLSVCMNGVLHYLNPKFTVSKTSAIIARDLEQRFTRNREISTTLITTCRELDIPIPSQLPPRVLPLLSALIKDNDRRSRLQHDHPRLYEALLLRLGLHPDHERVFRTFAEVGKLLNITGPGARWDVRMAAQFLKGETPAKVKIGGRKVLADSSTVTAAEQVGRLVAKAWNMNGSALQFDRRHPAFRVAVYLLHTVQKWPLEKIRAALGLNKVKTVKAICEWGAYKKRSLRPSREPALGHWTTFQHRLKELERVTAPEAERPAPI